MKAIIELISEVKSEEGVLLGYELFIRTEKLPKMYVGECEITQK